MKIFAFAAGVLLLAASSPLWLDAQVPSNWNVAGACPSGSSRRTRCGTRAHGTLRL